MKNVILKMRGGLGNQLFIFSYLLCLSKKYPELSYILDLSEYEKYKTRNFELEEYIAYSDIISEENLEQENSIYFKVVYKLLKYLDYANRKCNRIVSEKYFLKFSSLFGIQFFRHGDGALKILKYKKTLVVGYFQDTKYVDPCLDELVTLTQNEGLIFNFKKNNQFLNYINQIEKNKNNIAISMRLGSDYESLDFPIYKDKYFHEGIKSIIEKKHLKQFTIFVFADDIIKAKQIILDSECKNLDCEYVFIEDMSPTESLLLMNKCANFVISNSSFSWWGQKLSVISSDKQVVAPKKWFNDNHNLEDFGLYEENFILIDKHGVKYEKK